MADWALLHIDGQLLGGRYSLLGWNARPREKFAGYILHHPEGRSLRRSNYDVTGFVVFRPESWSCMGAGCSHFKYDLEQITVVGSSGAPVFSDIGGDYGYSVVGVHTNRTGCTASGSRFSKMFEDGRVRGALIHGNDYFLGTEAAANFDDSARSDYTPSPNPVILPPVIAEGDEIELQSGYGTGSLSFSLIAASDGGGSLKWQLLSGSGSNAPGSCVYFLKDRGAEASVVYEVPGGIKEKDRVSVRVSDTYGSDEITIHMIPDRVPVIGRVFGREVDADDELTVYISPQTREVTLRAIAFGESPEKLKWTIVDTSVNGATTARFLLNDAGENATRVSGMESVRVLYRRGSTAVTSGNFVTTVTDTLGQTDSFRVRMVVDAAAPVIANEGVMTTTKGKTLEVTIPYGSEQLILDLLTSSARAGLVGKPVSSTPTEAQALFLPADGEGALKVQLSIQSGVDEASFRIRVSNGSASEEITIRVEREQVIRVRLKVLLGGATR